MTDERIREALRTEAAGAPTADDLWARTTRRIHRRRRRRQAGVAALVLLAAIGIGTATLPALDAPREVVLGEADVPPDWRDVSVGDAVVSVPPDWEIVEVPADPCPAFDPDRPVLVHSEHGPPFGCPQDPDPFTGLAVAPLDTPPPGLPPAVLESGETVQAGTVPAWEVPAAVVTGAGSTSDEHTGVATLVVPGVEVAVEVRPGAHAEEIDAALDTLRPHDGFDAEGVVSAVGFTDDGDVSSGGGELVGWAIDADGRFHRWFSERVDRGPAGAAFWPAATGSRFGAVVETGESVRVVAARPGVDVPIEFPLAAGVSLETIAWSPGGEAVAWLEPGRQPRLALLEWEDPDALADGVEPARSEVSVTGLPDEAGLSLGWEVDDRGEHLVAVHGDDRTSRAEVPRDATGRPDLADPLVFTPG